MGRSFLGQRPGHHLGLRIAPIAGGIPGMSALGFFQKACGS